MPNPQAQIAVNDCLVGDAWSTTFTIVKDSQDFTTATVVAKLRPMGATTTTSTHTFTASLTGAVGSLVVGLALTSAETTSLGSGAYIGEIIVTVVSPAFGPYTLVQYTFNILDHVVT